MQPQTRSVGMAALRLGGPVLLAGLCSVFLADEWAMLDRQAIVAALHAIHPLEWVCSLVAVLAAFLAVAGQERAVMAYLGYPVDRSRGRIGAMATAAVSQTVGFGPLVGTIVRKRLLPELTLAQSAQVSLTITFGFFGGCCLLWLAMQVAITGGVVQAVGLFCLVLITLRHLGRLVPAIHSRLPDPFLLLRFLVWLTVDLCCLCIAAWMVMPDGVKNAADLKDFLPVFLTALGVGIASGSPAGTGPFEAILMDGLSGANANDLAAGIIAFRLSAYAIPAILGALAALLVPVVLGARWRPQDIGTLRRREDALVAIRPNPFALAKLSRAELHLALQGELDLMGGSGGAFWLRGQLPGCSVHLGDPVRDAARPGRFDPTLDAAFALSARHGRMAAFYRVGPRLAAGLRARGMAVLHIANEAILDPVTFSTRGANHSSLRRKLRHAEKAGVTVTIDAHPPLQDMAEVAKLWARSHGGERGFSMGRFNPATLCHQRVLLARGVDGRLLAFVTFHACRDEWVLDLIRFRPGIPDGTLYLAVTTALAAAGQEGIRRLSLAAVPVPGFGLRGPAGHVAKRLTAGAQGLAQFKLAFRPRWEPRYLAAPSRMQMGWAACVLARAIHFPARVRLAPDVTQSDGLGWLSPALDRVPIPAMSARDVMLDPLPSRLPAPVERGTAGGADRFNILPTRQETEG